MTRWWMIAGAMIACGCSYEPPVSADLPTNEIKLSGSIQSNGSLAIAKFSLSNQDGYSATLSASDTLFLAAGGVESELGALEGSYLAAVQTSETDLSLILERAGGERVESALPLPPAFALVAPPPPASRAAGVAVTWDMDPGDIQLQIQVRSPCFTPFLRNLNSDTGMFSIQEADTGTSTLECEIEVEITRTWRRDFSASLSPSYPAILQQIRTIRFITTP